MLVPFSNVIVCVGVPEPVSTGAPGPVSIDIPAIIWMTE